MSFITKEWKDRLVEFAGRRKLTNAATGEETIVEVARAEGMVSQPGDAFSAATMNDLEQRIKDGFHDLGGIRFGVDVDGNYGYYKDGADTVTPFRVFERISLGYFTGANTGTATFSAKGIAGYEKLTTANFAVVLSSLYVEGGIQGSSTIHVEKGSVSPVISYNASTGTVTLSGLLNSKSKWSGDHYYVAKSYVTGTLYCYS